MRCKWIRCLVFIVMCFATSVSIGRANEPKVTVITFSSEQAVQEVENKIAQYHTQMNQEQYDEIVDDAVTCQARNSKAGVALRELLKKYHSTLGNFVSITNKKCHLSVAGTPTVSVFYNSVFENGAVTESYVFRQNNPGSFVLVDYATWSKTIDLAYLDYLEWNDKGNTELYKRKNPLAALQNYSRSIAIYPNAEAYVGSAMCKIQLEKDEQAFSDLDNAVRLNRKMAGVVAFLRGEAYRRQKNYDAAVAAYEEAIAAEPQCIDAYYSQGLIYEEKKAVSLAIKAYETYVQKTLSSHRLNLAKIDDAKLRITHLCQDGKVGNKIE